MLQLTEAAEALGKDASCAKSREHFNTAARTLELVQPSEIETLLETIISVSVLSIRKTYRVTADSTFLN